MARGRAKKRKKGQQVQRQRPQELEPEVLEAELLENLEHLDDLPPERASEILALIERKVTIRAGPLPPAEELAKYEEVLPGSAASIFEEMKLNAAHRRKTEWGVTLVNGIAFFLGNTAAWLTDALLVGGSIWLISNGFQISGLVLIAAELVALRWGAKQGSKDEAPPGT